MRVTPAERRQRRQGDLRQYRRERRRLLRRVDFLRRFLLSFPELVHRRLNPLLGLLGAFLASCSSFAFSPAISSLPWSLASFAFSNPSCIASLIQTPMSLSFSPADP